MKILYKSLFRGWVEITKEQRERLIKHMNNGITGLSGEVKQNYIYNRFIIEQ
ncbi:TPA: hypothetical protein ACXDAZ_002685 [Clostridium botulinum]